MKILSDANKLELFIVVEQFFCYSKAEIWRNNVDSKH